MVHPSAGAMTPGWSCLRAAPVHVQPSHHLGPPSGMCWATDFWLVSGRVSWKLLGSIRPVPPASWGRWSRWTLHSQVLTRYPVLKPSLAQQEVFSEGQGGVNLQVTKKRYQVLTPWYQVILCGAYIPVRPDLTPPHPACPQPRRPVGLRVRILHSPPGDGSPAAEPHRHISPQSLPLY